jgi:hypothetical protein
LARHRVKRETGLEDSGVIPGIDPMSFQAATRFALRAVSRSLLILPATLGLLFATLSPPAVDTASAQGFSGFRGGGGFMRGSSSPRFNGTMSRSMTGGMSGRWGMSSKSVTQHGMGGMGGMRGMSGTTAGSTYPKGKRPPTRPPGGSTAENPPTKDDGGRHPRPPKRPGGGIVVLPPGGGGVPGGSGVVPPNLGGGGQPPSTPPTQFSRRSGTGIPPANERRYVPNEVMVELAPNVSQQAVNAMLRRHRLTRLSSLDLQLTGTSFQRLRINDRRPVPQVVRALEAEGLAMAVQPNYIATLQEMAAQASFPADLEQYALARMRMQEAHRLATGSRVLVAVIDSGVDTRHPELAGMVVSAFDAIGAGDRMHAHGTSIVGAIAARARLRGTAPSAHILAARAFGTHRNSNDGTTDHILKAIDWASARGARVINMSFAGAHDPAIARHLAAARQRGIVLVAAAGNNGPNAEPAFPAALPGVIAVTATDENDRIFRAANRGNHIVVAAPGVDLWLPTLDAGYRQTSGTSFAAAQVSGAIALMLERNPGLTPDAVRQALVSTARGLGPRPQFGAGLVDAYQAVLSVAPAAPAGNVPATAGVGASQ